MKKLLLVAVSFLMLSSFSTTLSAQVVVVKPVKPNVVVVKPHAPSKKHIWVEGYWKWNKRLHKYEWVEGHWVRARKNKVWVPGHWAKVPGGWKYVPGHWKRK